MRYLRSLNMLKGTTSTQRKHSSLGFSGGDVIFIIRVSGIIRLLQTTFKLKIMRNTIPFLLALVIQLFALNIVFSQDKEITLYPSLNGIYPFNSSAVISTLTVPQGLAVVLCNQKTQTIALTCNRLHY